MPRKFIYLGYHFIPVGNFPEMDPQKEFQTIVRALHSHNAPYAMSKERSYSWKEFYEACGNTKEDIFFCVENRKLYVPGENELFMFQPGHKSPLSSFYTDLARGVPQFVKEDEEA